MLVYSFHTMYIFFKKALLVEDKTIKYGYMNSSQDSSTIVHVSVFLIPFFSLIPLFLISKKAKYTYIYIYIYQFLPKKFMFAKYTKSRVYTCHVNNCISYLGTRGEP